MDPTGTILICGLGNPGRAYARTRHNAGFWLADALAGTARWKSPSPQYECATAMVGGREALIVKPSTYMNLSGRALRAVARGGETDVAGLLVLCDDFALPLGRIRIRPAGSDGGHNGLKSIIATLGTADFARLRLGVGPVPAQRDPADFVTEPMETADQDRMADIIEHSRSCVATWVESGAEVAMARFNGVDIAPREDGRDSG